MPVYSPVLDLSPSHKYLESHALVDMFLSPVISSRSEHITAAANYRFWIFQDLDTHAPTADKPKQEQQEPAIKTGPLIAGKEQESIQYTIVAGHCSSFDLQCGRPSRDGFSGHRIHASAASGQAAYIQNS